MTDSSLSKTYDFSSVEQRLYAWWEKRGYFKPRGNVHFIKWAHWE